MILGAGDCSEVSWIQNDIWNGCFHDASFGNGCQWCCEGGGKCPPLSKQPGNNVFWRSVFLKKCIPVGSDCWKSDLSELEMIRVRRGNIKPRSLQHFEFWEVLIILYWDLLSGLWWLWGDNGGSVCKDQYKAQKTNKLSWQMKKQLITCWTASTDCRSPPMSHEAATHQASHFRHQSSSSRSWKSSHLKGLIGYVEIWGSAIQYPTTWRIQPLSLDNVSPKEHVKCRLLILLFAVARRSGLPTPWAKFSGYICPSMFPWLEHTHPPLKKFEPPQRIERSAVGNISEIPWNSKGLFKISPQMGTYWSLLGTYSGFTLIMPKTRIYLYAMERYRQDAGL